ncbi:WD repeat-containing protein 87-like isoform X1 [Cyprinus carpio]|uniref:WD repeat-containing protein 87-like isoform X1 n=1 Tax=Cyprinus carpio TaxID=7962 RepID=A0A9Q9YCH4_CYPCA|nr:WD repeat-containing protein 87-like isoform X1 [Cyprinus carpio]XP_042617037.1 WD repeat-containing protein 87-like isoform X1 [Cyprinus carpio]XP_042617038.1 WD repeat-containing protein 87-like isoform X1 [Cyprinus carpio]
MVLAPEGTRGPESERGGVEEREILPSRAARWCQRGAPPCQTLGEEEHRLKVLQIDELQREVDKTLALLEKEREDCVKAKELEQLREEQLKDKLVEEQSTVSRLQCEQQEAEHQRDLLGTRVAALNCDIQQKDCMQLTEQDEVSSRDDLQAADRSRI